MGATNAAKRYGLKGVGLSGIGLTFYGAAALGITAGAHYARNEVESRGVLEKIVGYGVQWLLPFDAHGGIYAHQHLSNEQLAASYAIGIASVAVGIPTYRYCRDRLYKPRSQIKLF